MSGIWWCSRRRPGLLALTGAMLVALGACGEVQEAAPPGTELDRTDPGEPQALQEAHPRLPHFSPRGGPSGTEVELWMESLPPESPLLIGFGTVRQHEILKETRTDAEGRLRTTVKIPQVPEVDQSHYFFVADTTQRPLSNSEAFHVTHPDGTLSASGEVVMEDPRCPALRGVEDEIYTLVGDVPEPPEGELSDLPAGAWVRVEGRIAENHPCEAGLTIQVAVLEVEGSP